MLAIFKFTFVIHVDDSENGLRGSSAGRGIDMVSGMSNRQNIFGAERASGRKRKCSAMHYKDDTY